MKFCAKMIIKEVPKCETSKGVGEVNRKREKPS